MSHRLQVLIPETLDVRIRMAAKRARVSKGEWVRRAISRSLRESSAKVAEGDALSCLAALDAPTGDLDQMISEIDQGRG